MSKMWVIIKREYAEVVKKKSFLIGVILTPLFMTAVMVLPALLAERKPSGTERIAIIDLDGRGLGERFKEAISKYKVDDNRLAYEVTQIYDLPPDDTAEINRLRGVLDSLMLGKKLKSYLVLSKDIEKNDSCLMVAKSFGFRTNSRFDRSISQVLSEMRLENSGINLGTDSVLRLTRRVEFSQVAPGGKERDFLTMYLAGIVFVMIIFMTVLGYGQLLMRAVIEEKSSRIIEVIVSSVSPFQLMAGKIIGLGLASLTQVGIWIAIGGVIYGLRGGLSISAGISEIVFSPVFVVFFVVFLVLGYLLYSTLFALIGSICNNDKEAQNFIFPIVMALILPVMLAMYVVQEPDSLIAIVLSLIPFFTPTMMIQRLNIVGAGSAFSLSNPIILEATLGVIITAFTIVAVTWITARVFRVGILMYGKRPTLPEIIKWVRYK
jgi:ABC-2 type transport system permease protein